MAQSGWGRRKEVAVDSRKRGWHQAVMGFTYTGASRDASSESARQILLCQQGDGATERAWGLESNSCEP